MENPEWVKFAVFAGGPILALIGAAFGYGRALLKFNESLGVTVLNKENIRSLHDLRVEEGASLLAFSALLIFYEIVCIGGALIMGAILLGAVLLLQNNSVP
ncbi:MAG: hypothetical protein O2913_13690 [Chloroflexi bacterium]|nr:hypothetical protein [Chloroflexota bacterium]